MTPVELEQLLVDLDKQGMDRAYLQMYKPLGWKPRGLKIKTPLGMAAIVNYTQVKPHGEPECLSVAFIIEKAKIKAWLTKAKQPVKQSAMTNKTECEDCNILLAKLNKAEAQLKKAEAVITFYSLEKTQAHDPTIAEDYLEDYRKK